MTYHLCHHTYQIIEDPSASMIQDSISGNGFSLYRTFEAAQRAKFEMAKAALLKQAQLWRYIQLEMVAQADWKERKEIHQAASNKAHNEISAQKKAFADRVAFLIEYRSAVKKQLVENTREAIAAACIDGRVSHNKDGLHYFIKLIAEDQIVKFIKGRSTNSPSIDAVKSANTDTVELYIRWPDFTEYLFTVALDGTITKQGE